ncbi:hypothetical protein ACTI_03590 [Actinoplanes sp. OR16]|uniref:LytR C-terminal domain-containing protein n=1 Tax=Actinoplanes sp. OR16 TaxID=946334 RepID=UPI000F71BF49|nr:LytR C-terminal domain-containing protein [Actinoplanes sp. OR16]BBH63674.1 hypothetical protein ACTI_03590 [Actinoplanes sp. OR16]
MSRDPRELMSELEDDVRPVLLAPAAAIRARGRRRALRRRAAATGSALALVAAVAAGSMLLPRTPTMPAGPAASSAPACVPVELPASTSEVKVRVFAARNGAEIVQDLRDRGFDAVAGDPGSAPSAGSVAAVYVGPATVGQGRLIDAYLLGQAPIIHDPRHTGDVVDLAIGPNFQQFATPTEVNQALAHLTYPC